MEQITIKEVAKLCGVGVSTVSRAINNHPDINPETKQKILDVIREYNYVPNNSARNLERADSRYDRSCNKRNQQLILGCYASCIGAGSP